jgi:hypothetical protein
VSVLTQLGQQFVNENQFAGRLNQRKQLQILFGFLRMLRFELGNDLLFGTTQQEWVVANLQLNFK